MTIESVKFWINAFIPHTVRGYTQVVPGRGTHAGRTMIPHPILGKDCFLTDQRTFSNDIGASSRMHSEFTITFGRQLPVMTQWHHCDITIEVDCEDGDEEGRRFGDTSRMNFTLAGSGPDRAVVGMRCSANDPLARESRWFGEIDYFGTLLVDRAARTLSIQGCVSQFPAFEAYATINNGAGRTIFQLEPPPGNTVMDLVGEADRPVWYLLKDEDGDDVFETVSVLAR